MRTYTGQGSLDFIIKHIDKLNDFFSQYFEEMGIEKEPVEFLREREWYDEDDSYNFVIFSSMWTKKEFEEREDIEEEKDNREWTYEIQFRDKEKEERVYNALKEFDKNFHWGNV